MIPHNYNGRQQRKKVKLEVPHFQILLDGLIGAIALTITCYFTNLITGTDLDLRAFFLAIYLILIIHFRLNWMKKEDEYNDRHR